MVNRLDVSDITLTNYYIWITIRFFILNKLLIDVLFSLFG